MCGFLLCSEEDKRFFQDAVRTSTLDIVQRMREITIVMSMLEQELQQQGVTTEDLLGMTGLGPRSCLISVDPLVSSLLEYVLLLKESFVSQFLWSRFFHSGLRFVLCPSLEALVEDPGFF
jgi:hypothetical protein